MGGRHGRKVRVEGEGGEVPSLVLFTHHPWFYFFFSFFFPLSVSSLTTPFPRKLLSVASIPRSTITMCTTALLVAVGLASASAQSPCVNTLTPGAEAVLSVGGRTARTYIPSQVGNTTGTGTAFTRTTVFTRTTGNTKSTNKTRRKEKKRLNNSRLVSSDEIF